MNDKRLLEYFQAGGDLNALSDADLARLDKLTSGSGEQSSTLERAMRGADAVGLPETLGSIAGGAAGTAVCGPMGGYAGSVSGAMLANAIKNYFQGDSSMSETLGQGALEAVVPSVSKLAAKLGGKMVRSVLPITDKAAETANSWAKHEGVNKILSDLENIPGLRPKTVFRNVSDELTDATKKTVDLAASHGNITSRAIPQAAQREGMPALPLELDIPADLAKQIFSDSRFVEGAVESGDKLLRDKAFKTALGSELKTQIPGMADAMKRQSTAIPLKEALDALLTRGQAMPFSEVVVSGMKPRTLGIVKPPLFTSGRFLQDAGKLGQTPIGAGGIRAIPGLLELLSEILQPEPSH